MTPALSVAATRRAASSETVRSPKAPGEIPCRRVPCRQAARAPWQATWSRPTVRRGIASRVSPFGPGRRLRTSTLRQKTAVRARPSSGRGDLPVALGGAHPRSRQVASPSPVPASAAVARWKRSNAGSRWSSGIPGPSRPRGVRPGPRDSGRSPRLGHRRRRTCRRCRSGRRETVDPVGSRLDGEGPAPTRAVSATRRVVAAAPNRCTQAAATSATSTTSFDFVRGRSSSARASQSRSSTMPQPALSPRPVRAPPGRRRVTWSIERELHLGLDDRDRCPQLVRRVGRELRLSGRTSSLGAEARSPTIVGPANMAAARSAPNTNSATSSDEWKFRSSRQALPGDEAGTRRPPGGETERRAAELQRDRPGTPVPGGQGRRPPGERRSFTRGCDQPDEDWRVVDVGLRGRGGPGHGCSTRSEHRSAGRTAGFGLLTTWFMTTMLTTNAAMTYPTITMRVATAATRTASLPPHADSHASTIRYPVPRTVSIRAALPASSARDGLDVDRLRSDRVRLVVPDLGGDGPAGHDGEAAQEQLHQRGLSRCRPDSSPTTVTSRSTGRNEDRRTAAPGPGRALVALQVRAPAPPARRIRTA